MRSTLFKRGFSSLLVVQFFGAANDNILKQVLIFMVGTGIWKATLGEMITKAVDDALEGAAKKAKRTDSGLEQIITRAARGVTVHKWGKKPVLTVLITRLEDD